MKKYESLDTTLTLIASLLFLFHSNAFGVDSQVHYGEVVKMGQGTIRSYLAVESSGEPQELGILMSHDSLEGLPREPSTSGRCFDLNENGQIDPPDECEGDHEYVIALPAEATERSDVPFRWIGTNWNSVGHAPPHIYDLPHFDFHYYIASEESVRAIAPGSCGFFMDCAHFEQATKPVPARYVHKDHVNVDAAVVAMGNHLIDLTSPEFSKPPQKFTHTWIFGAYDGHITFYEPMITLEYLLTRPNICSAIKQSQAWEISGYYLTRYCIRYHDRANKYTVSLEGFRHRVAK